MKTREQTVSVATAVANSDPIPYEDSEFGTIHVPDGSSLTTLTFHTAEKTGGTYEPAYDDAATPAAVAITVAANQSHPIPSVLRGAGAHKITGNAAGTVILSLKG